MFNLIKTCHRIIFALAVTTCTAAMLTSCSDDVLIDNVDESHYQTGETFGYLRNTDIPRNIIGIDLNNATYEQPVIFGLSQGVSSAQSVSVVANTSLVASYNRANFTNYEAFPAGQVTVPGTISIDKWRTESAQFKVIFSKGSLANGEYLLPVSVTTSGNNIKIEEKNKVLYYIVKVGNPVPDNSKPYKVLCYVEVNEQNILNVGSYTLKNSGKQFFDVAVIFASNINYNYDTKRPELRFNPNVQHILSNRDKYIKPLQDKGIKVVLSVLGNHDFTGLSVLTGQLATDFAAQCKAVVEAYGLDGIDLDDEHSEYLQSGPISQPSQEKFAELVLALRDAMPDKMLTVYNMGYAASMPATLNGRKMADAIDHISFAYYNNYSQVGRTPLENTYPKSKYCSVPAWINKLAPIATKLMEYTQKYSIEQGNGTVMFYDLTYENASSYLSHSSMPLFGEEVVMSGPSVKKDY